MFLMALDKRMYTHEKTNKCADQRGEKEGLRAFASSEKRP
jgi:hypothetical protein